jgi:hypothetical protein
MRLLRWFWIAAEVFTLAVLSKIVCVGSDTVLWNPSLGVAIVFIFWCLVRDVNSV